jgi:hypothetical protein
MHFEDEKDYIMRIIKEAISVLFSFLLGKTYVSVELERENHYEVSGQDLNGLLEMIDQGQINEAENILLGRLDYRNRHEVAAAALFYQYLSEKEESFLKQHNYSHEEILDGLKQLIKKSGYKDLMDVID